MAIGTYSPIKSSDISPNDLDMYYTYSPNREENSNDVLRLNPVDLLEELNNPTDEQVGGEENLLEGMYNLTLPATIFNQLGFYTIYIRAKQIRNTIIDCGVLSATPSIKGIVLDANSLPVELTANNALQGYRIEYLNTDGSKLRNTVRYVVTANKVIPVTENIGNTSQTAIRYRFDDSGSLIFLQLTPSSASSVKPNLTPFIGNPNQTILMQNTNVNPMAIEVEFVKNDIDTIADLINGDQIKDVKNSIITKFDDDKNIISQHNLFEIKDDVSGEELYEVKETRKQIDNSQNFNDVVDDIIE